MARFSGDEDSSARVPPERLLTRVSEDGVVRRHDAFAIGLKPHHIDRVLQSGFLRGDGNGAYRLAGAEREALTAERAAMAATTGLAIGMWSALARAGLSLRWVPNDAAHVHVMIDYAARTQSTDWYTVHPTRRLDPDLETTLSHDVRITTIPRSIRDLAATLKYTPFSERQLHAWIDEARAQNKLEVAELGVAAELEQSRKIRRRLMHLHDAHVGIPPEAFKSIGEEWLRDLVKRRGLPTPLWNVQPAFASKELDAYFVDQLIVEFDGYWVHRPRGKHHRDRRGDRRALVDTGIPTVRVTKWDFEHDLPQLEDDLEYLLTHSRGEPSAAGRGASRPAGGFEDRAAA